MILFDDVTKFYPKQEHAALSKIDLTVPAGEFAFLVGPSGSGKSTFLRLVLREHRTSLGRVTVDGRDLQKLPGWRVPLHRRGIGMVFQDFRLLPGKTVHENIAFAMQVTGRTNREINQRVPEVIDLVGLTGKESRLPAELSGGEQQRVAVARAVVNEPPIVLADEPTGNLDPATSVGIMKLFDRINRNGATIVMATHDATMVDQMRKRVIQLNDGLIVRDQSRGVYGHQ